MFFMYKCSIYMFIIPNITDTLSHYLHTLMYYPHSEGYYIGVSPL